MDFSPLWISLKTGTVSIIITFFLGLLAAWWVFSLKKESVRVAADGVFTMPMVLPPTVAGFFLLLIFGSNGPLGKLFINAFGYKITFSWAATVLAAVIISFPLMYRTARSAFEQVDQDMVDAARTLGMSEFTIFRRVLVPNAAAGIAGGTVLAFARGLGEFGATMMIAGNIQGKTRTLPMAVYSKVSGGDMEGAAIYVAIIMIICFAAVVIVNVLQAKIRKRQNGR